MTTDLPSDQIHSSTEPPRRFSRWSTASLGLLAAAILFVALVYLYQPDEPAGPAEAAGIVLVRGMCFVIAWSCTLAGSITGIIGVRRTGRQLGLAKASLWLNAILCVIVVPIVAFSAMFE
jgi:hypothetical protein